MVASKKKRADDRSGNRQAWDTQDINWKCGGNTGPIYRMNSRACRIREEVVNSLQGWEPFFGGWNRKIRQIIYVRIATPLFSLSKTTVTGLDSSLPSSCVSIVGEGFFGKWADGLFCCAPDFGSGKNIRTIRIDLVTTLFNADG